MIVAPRRTLFAIAAWCAVALVLWPLQRRIDAGITLSSSVAGTESAEADRIFKSDLASPFTEPALLVMSGLSHAADSDSGRADVRAIIAPLLASRAVVAALSPGSSLDTLLVGTDRTTAIAIVGLTPGFAGAMDSARGITRAHIGELRRTHPGLQLRWTGQPALVGDLRAMGAREARRAELRALPVTLVVAIVAFGALVSAGVAVLAAALAIGVSLGVMGAFAGMIPASTFTRTLVPMIGLALTVDYVLFITRRARDGADIRSLRTTVLVAAGIVALGFSGLAIAPTGELRSAAIAGAITCIIAAFAAISIAPRESARAVAADVSGWHRWATFVVRRPWLTLVVAALPLAALANAARSVKLATPLDQLLPAGMESADAVGELRRVGRASAAGSSRVLVVLPSSTAVFGEDGWRAVAAATRAMRALPGAADARSIATIGTGDRLVAKNVLPAIAKDAFVSKSGSIALVDVLPNVVNGNAAAVDLVRHVRALDAAAVTGVAGARFVVAGLPAYALDYESALRHALPWIVVATSLATLIALTIALRAPIVAVKAVALNLLVAAAAIGATVLVFQDGYGAALIGQHALGSIFPTVPALAFGAAFGTSLDYELFLIAGVREARHGAASESDAILLGLARTGGLITRAAAVMACLFLAFSTSALLPLAMVGFTLAVAVALDATFVRLALAPALLRIAGRWNWWPG